MADSSQLVVLAPHALYDYSGRPRRFLDAVPMPSHGRAIVGAWFQNDEQLECDYSRKQGGALRRLGAAFRLVWKHYGTLRRARMIYCLNGMHYTVLLLLSRCGLFSTEGKIIRRVAYHDTALQRLVSSLQNASPAFQLDCITSEQFATTAQQLGARRVILRPWKIDTGWFQPPDDVPKTRILLPGNISRDESMVAPLLHGGLSITRMARIPSLLPRFADEIANPRFELVMNASHREYLEHLHAAPMVLLPIVPCDNPAGLTAAMEAISAGVPVLANHSMGLTELFSECHYPVPMLHNLDPDAWAQACHQIEDQRDSPDFLAALDNSRQLLLKRHSILPAGEDWEQIFAEASTADSAISEAAFGAASSPA
ncbi:MAG: hypothetical protein WAW39_14500 [Prosthecobacter sp.]